MLITVFLDCDWNAIYKNDVLVDEGDDIINNLSFLQLHVGDEQFRLRVLRTPTKISQYVIDNGGYPRTLDLAYELMER